MLEGPDSFSVALTSFGEMRAAHVCGIGGYDRTAGGGVPDVASVELLAVRSSKGGAKNQMVGSRMELRSWHAHK